jgi:membrane-bound metal-dependent hydrolase YbcI (DUF457 family)
MGVGHLAASFALRGRFPRVPLFYLLAAGVLLDLLWALAILAGLEHAHIGSEQGSAIPIVLDSVPYTHSLVAALVWGALVCVAWWLWRRDRSVALVLGGLVASHWLLDFVSHVPDMPVLPSGPLIELLVMPAAPAALPGRQARSTARPPRRCVRLRCRGGLRM